MKRSKFTEAQIAFILHQAEEGTTGSIVVADVVLKARSQSPGRERQCGWSRAIWIPK
jgi:hypothetical protein